MNIPGRASISLPSTPDGSEGSDRGPHSHRSSSEKSEDKKSKKKQKEGEGEGLSKGELIKAIETLTRTMSESEKRASETEKRFDRFILASEEKSTRLSQDITRINGNLSGLSVVFVEEPEQTLRCCEGCCIIC